MKNLSIIVVLTILVLQFGCDVVEPPYTKTGTIDTNITKVKRKVLIEEFTGVRCQNCPKGHAEIIKLKSIYGERLIPISIHANSVFAAPLLPDYPDDFRTPAGDQLYIDFQNPPQPGAVINRTMFDGSISSGRSGWAGYIANQDSTEAMVTITPTSTYNASSKTTEITVNVKFIKDVNEKTNLVMYVLEDSVVSPQLDGSKRLPDYVHRDMLRDMPYSPYGQALTTTATKANTSLTKNYTYAFTGAKSSTWNIKHCLLVFAVVVNNGSEKTVLQAEEIHVTK